MKNKKNLITFLETKGEIGEHPICFDGNHFNADYFRDNLDLKSFHPYKITKVSYKKGAPIIELEGIACDRGFAIDGFCPHDPQLRKEFRGYLENTHVRPSIC